jgi:hypothetical protein
MGRERKAGEHLMYPLKRLIKFGHENVMKHKNSRSSYIFSPPQVSCCKGIFMIKELVLKQYSKFYSSGGYVAK